MGVKYNPSASIGAEVVVVDSPNDAIFSMKEAASTSAGDGVLPSVLYETKSASAEGTLVELPDAQINETSIGIVHFIRCSVI